MGFAGTRVSIEVAGVSPCAHEYSVLTDVNQEKSKLTHLSNCCVTFATPEQKGIDRFSLDTTPGCAYPMAEGQAVQVER
jgi:hypothetical protein